MKTTSQKNAFPEEDQSNAAGRCIRICLVLYVLSGLLRGYAQCFDCLIITDYVIYGKDTISVQEHLLQSYAEGQELRLLHLGKSLDSRDRIYWRIVGEQVKLVQIQSALVSKDQINQELHILFGRNLDSGPFAVHLPDQMLHGMSGKLLYSGPNMLIICEKDWEIDLFNGRQTGVRQFDNSKTRTSVFVDNQRLLSDFVISSIDWARLPPLTGKEGRVFVAFSGNDQGIIDQVQVLRGLDPVIDKEVIRAIKTIPDWPVFYRRGAFQRFKYNVPIRFSEEERRRHLR